MRASLTRIFLALLAMLVAPAIAGQDLMPPSPYAHRQLEDATQEQAASALMATIRCVTCQGQSIIDSNAPMASDMRHQIRTRIASGESPDAIRAWLVERYGDYISYEPRLTGATWPLFLVPIVFLLLAAWVFWRRLRGRQ